MEPIFDLDDPKVLKGGVGLLQEFAKPAPSLVTANFGVAIAVLIHRSVERQGGGSGPPALVHDPDTGPTIPRLDLQFGVCDVTYEKDSAFLFGKASGPIYKPFSGGFKGRSPGVNNWRNSLDLQTGIGCDAPYTAEYLRSDAYLEERRWYCAFRDPATGACSSPAGPEGTATCFNPAKRGTASAIGTRARHRPKLLSRGTPEKPGYWYIEPTAGVLEDLLGAPDRRVPLYPWIAAMYGGSPYFRHWGIEITRSRFERDLKLDAERFLAVFDPEPSSPLNARLLDGLGLGGLGPATTGTATQPTPPAPVGGPDLSAPVPFRRRSVGPLISRAEASADPAQRARLLERARRGHQRTLEELVGALRARGKFKLTEQLDGYDLLARTADVAHLFEVKTWAPGNLSTQIRRGWRSCANTATATRRACPTTCASTWSSTVHRRAGSGSGSSSSTTAGWSRYGSRTAS